MHTPPVPVLCNYRRISGYSFSTVIRFAQDVSLASAKAKRAPFLRSVFRNGAEADAPDGGDELLVVDLGEDQGGLRVLAGRGCFVGLYVALSAAVGWVVLLHKH